MAPLKTKHPGKGHIQGPSTPQVDVGQGLEFRSSSALPVLLPLSPCEGICPARLSPCSFRLWVLVLPPPEFSTYGRPRPELSPLPATHPEGDSHLNHPSHRVDSFYVPGRREPWSLQSSLCEGPDGGVLARIRCPVLSPRSALHPDARHRLSGLPHAPLLHELSRPWFNRSHHESRKEPWFSRSRRSNQDDFSVSVLSSL